MTGCGGRSLGERTFAAKCGGCHTLTGHDTRADGGDLALGTFSVADVEAFAAVMPVRPRLGRRELHAVAVYVTRRRDAAVRARR